MRKPEGPRCAAPLQRGGGDGSDIDHLLALTVLNVVIGNADAHAKNFSLLHSDTGAFRLAPAYDLMSTAPYPQVSTTLGMFIADQRDITQVPRQALLAEAVSWGLPSDRAEAHIAHVLQRIADAIDPAAADIAPPDGLIDRVEARIRGLSEFQTGSRTRAQRPIGGQSRRYGACSSEYVTASGGHILTPPSVLGSEEPPYLTFRPLTSF